MNLRSLRPGLLFAAALGAPLLPGATELRPPPVPRIERGALVMEGIPQLPDELLARVSQFQNARSTSFQDWDPVRGIYVLTRFGETNQVHRVATPGGARWQLTFFADRVGGVRACPSVDAPGFLFTRDSGGGEFHQIFHYDGLSGRSRLLTDGGRTQHSLPRWAHDGDRFAFTSTRRNGRDRDVHVARLSSAGASAPLLERSGTWTVLDWSTNDTLLLISEYKSINESTLHIVTVESGEVRQVNPTREPVAYGDATFAHGGRGIYFTSDEAAEFQKLRHLDLDTGRITLLAPEIDWDVVALELSPDGRTLAFVVNEGGVDRVHVLDTRSGRHRLVSRIPPGQISGLKFHRDSRQLALTLNNPRRPGDAFVYHTVADRLERWTTSEGGGLDAAGFVMPEIVHYPTFDRVEGRPRQIPALYYRPPGKGRFPVLIIIHGGPESQATPAFSTRTPYFTNEMGLAVLQPNVRGSSGYGKSYLKLDNGRRREDSVRDIGALLDWIAKRPELDASRVAVHGGSYGGYMVLASMVHHGSRLRCGIDVVGISNFVTFLENTEDYRRDLRRAEYGDERDPAMRAFLEQISPLNHVARINRPLFVIQGQNDPRVPVGESEQMVRAIRARGGEVWYLLARDEGHGFARKSNADFQFAAMVRFLETHLLQR